MKRAACSILLIAAAALAHSGGLDSQGGHNDRSAGTYHFHQGPLDGQSFANKDDATAALLGDVPEDPIGEFPSAQLPPVPQGQIRLASWNIRIYSTGSRDDSELALIADRLQQFDLIAIQEVRDEEVVRRTLDILKSRGQAYEAMVSPPIGRGVKERYAFMWRPEKVFALDAGMVFADPDDVFIREPFYASFVAGSFDFTLISIHVIFGDGIGERRAENVLLDDVYRTVQDADPNEQDVILLGDFNLQPEDSGMSEVEALLDPVYTGAVRTTISDASLYDNFWWDPKFVSEWSGDSGVEHFDEAVFGNDDDAASLALSDHRPIWVTFLTDRDDDGDIPTSVERSNWCEVKRGDRYASADRGRQAVCAMLGALDHSATTPSPPTPTTYRIPREDVLSS
jgi:endonuclease/exonuclease/phosphatase family metal-dependent hydrolase